MALSGNLKDFSFVQLLNLVNLANKSGALYFERVDETYKATFRDGKLAYLESPQEDNSLLELLTQAKLIKPNQKNILGERLQGSNDKEIGIYLVSAGYLTQDQILDAIENDLTERLRELYNWQEGFFRFEAGELTPEDHIPARLKLENLIVEGARLLKEQEELTAEIPSLEMALKFTDRPGTDIKELNLSKEEWSVVSYVNPKNSIQQIARTTHLDDLQVRKVVYGLIQAGLVELIRPDGQPPRLPSQMFPTKNKEEQKSLVNRLINRIRSI